MKKKLRTILECIIGSVSALLFWALTESRTDPWYLIFSDPEFWIGGGVACLATSFGVVYFVEINPREFYYCIDIAPSTICLTVSTIALIVSVVLISLMQDMIWKILLLILVVVVYLLLIYLFMHRGVCVYQNGKIRVFNGKIKTYIANKIENIEFDYQRKKCTITITINGNNEVFVLSNFSAKSAEKRLKQFSNQSDKK